MGRKTQITKEDMLYAGLSIIIENGEDALSIKSVAARLGCSTQPISWSFESFEGYLLELRGYAFNYMMSKMKKDDGSFLHESVGYEYIKTATREPNLIRYLRRDEGYLRAHGGIGGIFLPDIQNDRKAFYSEKYMLKEADAEELCRFFVIYTEGIVSLILSGVLPRDAEAACEMLTNEAREHIIRLRSSGKDSN